MTVMIRKLAPKHLEKTEKSLMERSINVCWTVTVIVPIGISLGDIVFGGECRQRLENGLRLWNRSHCCFDLKASITRFRSGEHVPRYYLPVDLGRSLVGRIGFVIKPKKISRKVTQDFVFQLVKDGSNPGIQAWNKSYWERVNDVTDIG